MLEGTGRKREEGQGSSEGTFYLEKGRRDWEVDWNKRMPDHINQDRKSGNSFKNVKCCRNWKDTGVAFSKPKM